MKTTMVILSAGAVLLTAGCKTTETTPVPWNAQSAYMAKVRDPRVYGYSIYQTPGGVEYRGGSRVHPNQVGALPMQVEEPLRPVVQLRGNFGLESTVLFDLTVSASWLEFDLAQSLGAVPVGESRAKLVRTSGEEIPGCLSAIPALRFQQLYIEYPLVYVRMATGPIGSLARGMEKMKKPEIKGVIGWDILKRFEQIQLDYSGKRVVISTAEVAYEPNPARFVASIPLVKHAGVCAIRGRVDGKETLILIDPAGDFEVATDGAVEVSSVQLGDDLVFSAPVIATSPGGTRIGARLLQKYDITICPQAKVVYFERLLTGEEK